MKRWKTILYLAIGIPLGAAAEDGSIVSLRETISKIVDTKALASEERRNWEGRKEEMGELLKVHRRELELLEEELAQSGSSAGAYVEKEEADEKELEDLGRARRMAGETVVRNRERMLALARLFPAPLAGEVEPELRSLEDWASGDEPRDGLQAILGLVTKAERFNRRITRGREEREGRAVEVIYLGLARAFYADRSGSAGVGVPTRDGWEWSPRPDLNGEVVKALDELDRKRPPELVELPVKIGDLGG